MTARPDPFIGATRVPWLRALAQGLRLFALVVGIVATSTAGWVVFDVVVVVLLVVFLVWRWLPVAADRRLRDVIAIEVAITTVGVLLTGGWGSPWLLSQLVPIGLAALGLQLQRTALLALAVGVATTLASAWTWPGLAEVLLRASMLALVAGFGAVTRAVLTTTPGDTDAALGRLDDLWSVRAMLQGLHTTVADSGARFDIAEAVATVRSGSEILQRADVLALLRLQPDGTLRSLHAAGLPDHQLRMRDLPQRVGEPRRDGAPFTLELTAAGGLGRHARHGAYLWLPVEAHEDEHVLVVEFDERQAAIDEVLPELARIARPLAVTVSNATWFSRVQHLGVDEERQRIAARLHDQFAQSLTVVSMRLEAATRRHPDDPEIGELRAFVRETLSGLRDTMVELRAAVDEEQALPLVLHGLVERLGDRHGVIAEVTVVDEGPRPPRGVEQQLLRIAQELTRRAVEERNAIAVYVHYEITDEVVELRVSDDGEAPPPTRQQPVVEVVRDRAEAVGGEVDTHTGPTGLAAVTVRIARQSAPRRVEV